MAQGTRGRWVRVATTGLGVLLCTTLIGCMNTDKNKKDKLATKQVTPGLPNTPMLGANGQPIAKNGAPNNQFGIGGVIQQTGGVQPRVGSNGLNTNTGGTAQPNYQYYPNQPGAPATISPPGQQGFLPSVQPNWNGSNTSPVTPGNPLASAAPTFPAHLDPLPPPPPGSPTASGSGLVAVQPPTNNLAPIAPPTAPPVIPGKEQAYNFSPGLLGSK